MSEEAGTRDDQFGNRVGAARARARELFVLVPVVRNRKAELPSSVATAQRATRLGLNDRRWSTGRKLRMRSAE